MDELSHRDLFFGDYIRSRISCLMNCLLDNPLSPIIVRDELTSVYFLFLLRLR